MCFSHKRTRMITCFIVGFAAYSAVFNAMPASARQPEVTTINEPFEGVLADCGSFLIEESGMMQLRATTFFQGEDATRLQFHWSFRSTLTNSVTGAYLQESSSNTETLDLEDGTRTITGNMFNINVHGEGTVVRDVGRVVFSAPGVVTFEAGNHDVLYNGLEVLCSALD